MKSKFYTLLLILLGFFAVEKVNACQAAFSITPDVANPGNFFFQNGSTGTYTYAFISYGDGTGGSLLNGSGYHSYTSQGMFYVCLTIADSASGCQSTYCDSLVVGTAFPTCNATFSSSASGLAVNFTDASTSSSGIITDYYWTFGDGTNSYSQNPVHTYAQGGSYNVCFTMTDSVSGCSDQTCSFVTVTSSSGNCDATFSVSDSANIAHFYPLTANANQYTFSWNFGDGSSSTSFAPSHTYLQSGPYIVCLTVTDLNQSCTVTYCDTLVLNSGATCQAVFSTQAGTGNQMYFYASNPAQNITSAVWNFGDNSGLYYTTNPVHVFPAPGQYTVCLAITTSSGCTDSACQIVTVGNSGILCDASFTTADSAGLVFFFPNVNNANISYLWIFGDGSSSNSIIPVHQYFGNGPWNACLTIIDSVNQCSAQQCMVITNPATGNCNAAYSYIYTPGTTIVNFTNTSTGNITNYFWSFGDGTSSNVSNPVHTFSTQGTFVVCLTVYNNSTGCQSAFCDSVVVGNGSANQCVPQFFSFPDSSVIGSGVVNFILTNQCPGFTYTWSVNGAPFGTGTSPVIQFPDSGWYYICVEGVDSNGIYITCDSVYSFRLSATGISENNKQIGLAVTPNPANGPLTVTYQLAKAENVTVQLMSVDGREVYAVQLKSAGGLHKEVITTDNIPSGMYLLRLTAGDQQSILRVAIQH